MDLIQLIDADLQEFRKRYRSALERAARARHLETHQKQAVYAAAATLGFRLEDIRRHSPQGESKTNRI